MTHNYLVKICTPNMVTVSVVADSFTEAKERALRHECKLREEWKEEAHIKTVKRLEE